MPVAIIHTGQPKKTKSKTRNKKRDVLIDDLEKLHPGRKGILIFRAFAVLAYLFNYL